jgi:hypothetical protein
MRISAELRLNGEIEREIGSAAKSAAVKVSLVRRVITKLGADRDEC